MKSVKLIYGITIMLVAALTGCGGSSGGGTNPPPPPPPSRTPQLLAYSAGDGISVNGTTEMYAVQDDGSGQVLLSVPATFDSAIIRDFAVSPDGGWVAYVSDVNSFNETALFVNSIDGGTPIKVSRDPGPAIIAPRVHSFQWSPDSTQIAYAGNFGDGGFANRLANEVFLVNRDGSSHARISGGIGSLAVVEVRNPQWSPDGRYILQDVANYNSNNGGSTNAFALNIHDTTISNANSRRLVTSLATLRNPTWSPDSSRVSYLADQQVQGTYGIFAISADGRGNALVTEFADFNSDSRWSPDGATLAYLDHPSQPFPSDLIVSAASAGGQDTVLVFVSPDNHRVFDYAWSPDGSRIAYSSDESPGQVRELYVINSDGSGNPTKVNGGLVSGGDVFEFAWSPNGSQIAYLADQDSNTFIHLYVSGSYGSGNTSISTGLNGEEVVDFSWSRGGQRLTFSTGAEGRTPQPNKLYVSQPNGSGLSLLSMPMAIGPLRFEYD